MNNSSQGKNQMRVNTLIDGFLAEAFLTNPVVSGITCDSREVEPGFLFIAMRGDHADGNQFIDQAVDAGAVAIVAEHALEGGAPDLPIVIDPDIRAHIGKIASRFYQHPSRAMQVIGVTGTNGKTSISHFIAHALEAAGLPSGLIGTLGAGRVGHIQPGAFTTPEAITVHQQLAEFNHQAMHVVAMEVSSHGLVQHRVAGVSFDIAVFTNLTHDHLDYHGNMEAYWAAKRQLFDWPTLKAAVINVDDPYGLRLAEELASRLPVYAVSLQGLTVEGAHPVLAQKVVQNQKGARAQISTPWGSGQLNSQVLGRFNISNLLATLCVMALMEISLEKALPIIKRLDTVPGRMQCIRLAKRPMVVVDYAHTPDALEQALMALRPHVQGKLWVVFGCGGGRDREKRAKMGQIAERFGDRLVITNDNPRDEDPDQIVQDILSGLLCAWAAEIEMDRGCAIAHAISCAEAGDIVLIAGKGHEEYQQIGAQRLPFSDVAYVKAHFNL